MSKVLKFGKLAEHSSIIHAISTKAHGTMKKEDGTIHHANVLHFINKANISATTICMDQVHGNNVVVIENDRELVMPKTDGLITRNHDVSLGVVTADCLPILFYDTEKNVIGIAHAGRKGLAKGIIDKMVAAFTNSFASNPGTIVASIGPGIERDCYEVGKEIIEEIDKTFPDYENIYTKKDATYFLDLYAIAVQSLRKAGILKKHIEVTELCTKCNPDLVFSYRNGDKTERFISVIGFKKTNEK